MFQDMASWVPIFRNTIEGELTLNEKNPPFVSFQLATVDAQGVPHVRTMVYRGFLFNDKTTNVLTFVTDKRMNKYEELKSNDKFEAVFYFQRMKKQMRFRGRARIVDQYHKPNIELSSIQSYGLVDRSADTGSDSETEEQANTEIKNEMKNVQSDTLNTLPKEKAQPHQDECTKARLETQAQPLRHDIISPGISSQLSELDRKTSFGDLLGLSRMVLTPPTEQEWNQEIRRHWEGMSRNMKMSFRKPPPKSELSPENLKTIDSILRGVDGKKDDDGLANFSVVALFVDYVDAYDSEKDKRVLFEKDTHQVWHEHLVCP